MASPRRSKFLLDKIKERAPEGLSKPQQEGGSITWNLNPSLFN